MELHRVFPYLDTAKAGEPGHPLYVHPDQGDSRWDNPALYLAFYASSTAAGAIGEVFQSQRKWRATMLAFPSIPGAVKSLATFLLDEDRYTLLDLDDSRTLVDLGIRPTQVVIRDRPLTQRIARDIFQLGRHAGITYWSNVRPQWRVHALWDHSGLALQRVEHLIGHPGMLDANDRLYKPPLHKSLRR